MKQKSILKLEFVKCINVNVKYILYISMILSDCSDFFVINQFLYEENERIAINLWILLNSQETNSKSNKMYSLENIKLTSIQNES